MGLAKLNVWIADERAPCAISNQSWVVFVTYCNGRPVTWCGNEARFTAKCGHVDIELPPGCYVIWGVLYQSPLPWLRTHSTNVTVSCDNIACVHLYVPTTRETIRNLDIAAQALAQEQALPRDKVEQLREALAAVLEHLPKTTRDAELDLLAGEMPKRMEQLSGQEQSMPE